MWNLVRNSFTGKALCTATSSWWRINLAWGVVIFCLFQTSHFYVEYLVHSQILRNKFWMNISLKVRNIKVTKKELRMFTLLILTFSGLGESGDLHWQLWLLDFWMILKDTDFITNDGTLEEFFFRFEICKGQQIFFHLHLWSGKTFLTTFTQTFMF